jgi:TRAP-type transport system periplasmic protein
MRTWHLMMAAGSVVLTAGAAQAADPIPVRMANSVPATSHMNVRIFDPWCKRVTAESGGTVDAKLFPANAIATSRNMWDRTLSGVVDIGYVSPAYVAGKFPGAGVTEIPFLVNDAYTSSIAFWNMIEHGALKDEFKEVKVLAAFVYPGSGLAAGSEPIRRIEDMKGKKIAVGNRLTGDLVESLGAAPVTIVFSETYQSLMRHTVDAVAVGFTGIQPLKLYEVAKHYTTVLLGSTNVIQAMNKQTYAKLPEQGKAAIERNSGEKWTRELGKFWDDVAASGRKLVEAQKDTHIYDPSPAEEARWENAAAPMAAEWVKRTHDGAKILAEFKAERAKANKAM